MRRDMDLIREILNTVGDSTGPVDAKVFVDATHDFDTVAYNVDLIRQARLAYVNLRKAWSGQVLVARVGPLTWEGNDFLDSIRNDTVWKHVKKKIATTVGSVSFDVVKALAVKTATDMLL